MGVRLSNCTWAAALLILAACGSPEPASTDRAPTTETEQGGTTGAAACPDHAPDQASDPGVSFDQADTETATAWQMPGDVSLTVSAENRGPLLVVTAVLRNEAAEPREVFYLTGGAAVQSTNPFNVTLPLTLRHPRPDPPPGPEVYPAPYRASLPPGASVRFVRPYCLADYQTIPGQAVAVRWSFELWNGARPGTVDVTLP